MIIIYIFIIIFQNPWFWTFTAQKIDSNPLVVVLSCNKNEHLWSKIIEKNINNLIIFCGDRSIESI